MQFCELKICLNAIITCKPGESAAMRVRKPFSYSCKPPTGPFEAFELGPISWKRVATNTDDDALSSGNGQSSKRE